MSASSVVRARAFGSRRRAGLAVGLVSALALAGCSAARVTGASDGSTPPAPDGSPSTEATSPSPEEPTPVPTSVVQVRSNIPAEATSLPVDRTVALRTKDGSFTKVTVVSGKKKVPLAGGFSKAKTRWTSTDRLEPGRRYVVRTVAEDADGLTKRTISDFRTAKLTLADQTYPSIAPLQGEKVGVGMPVIVSFDVPVTDRAAIEKHLRVESSPKQAGAWHWLSDNEVHWRPKTYWRPGTKVAVHADINSVPAGNGIYGQLSRDTSFTVGDAIISRVDVQRHVMRVFRNGTLLRTVPVSAGKAGFETRSGTKVIIEKFRDKRMDAATTGIAKDDPEYYNLDHVEYAMRVTYSGEFLHAAPWSVGSQGSANVSHGCVGMSTADAGWLYNLSKRGDVVEVRGTDRQMTLDNGYGDWNESFRDYAAGSALS